MSANTKRMEHQLIEVVTQSAALRKELEQYEGAMEELGRRLGTDEAALSAVRAIDAPARRRLVTDAMKAFEGARHRLRLILFALAEEDGLSVSDMARALGFSRQLASRLAREAVLAGLTQG